MMTGPEKYSGNLRAIYAMMFAVAMFSLMDTAMKILAAQYPAIQVAALRALVSLPLLGVYVLWRGAARSLLRVRWPLHLGRGVIAIVVAMGGVLVVLRPDGLGFLTIGGLAVLASAVCYAVSASLASPPLSRRARHRRWRPSNTRPWPGAWRSIGCSGRRCLTATR